MLYRGQSFGSSSKRAAKQVMAIGLAPDNDQNVEDDSETQRRLRAESRFTFRPEEGSEVNENSRQGDFEDEEADQEDSLLSPAGGPETAIQFFAVEFKEVLDKDFSQLRPHLLK